MAAGEAPQLAPPPCIAVIFTSKRTSHDEADYVEAAARMERLAREQPGFLGLESVRDQERMGITVSYWESEEAALAWKNVSEHLAVQSAGRTRFYEWYRVRVATVTRVYGS